MIAYAITSPDTLHFNTLKKDLDYIATLASMVVYRDKHIKTYKQNAKYFIAQAKNFDKVLLHTDYLLAKELGADGIHLSSMQSKDIPKAKSLGLFVVISTHTLEEAKRAQMSGADMVTFSPVFDTPNKAKAVGIAALATVVNGISIPVLALGGILTKEQIDACQSVGAKGFAAIRYFDRKVLSSL